MAESEAQVPVLSVRARVPRSRTGFLTLVPVGLAIRLADLVRNRFHLHRVRQRSRDVGFPLDRHMTIELTATHLMTWRTPVGRPRESLGAVERSDIVSARLPFVGGGAWRTMQLHLVHGAVVRFQVEAELAERFVDEISSG